jgi:DNA-binding NarL/FixJ family response regulator
VTRGEFEAKRNAANAVLELNSELSDIRDIDDFPQRLQHVLGKYIPSHWCSLYFATNEKVVNAVTNSSLPFNWDELYREVVDMDMYARHVIGLNPGEVCVQAEVSDPSNEGERYCRDFTEKHTNTFHFMNMSVVKDRNGLILLGFYGMDRQKGFTKRDKELLCHMGPLIINTTRTLMLYRDFEYKRVAFEKLAEMEGISLLIFDEHLNLNVFPESTRTLLREACNRLDLSDVPEQILEWVRTDIAPEGKLVRSTGYWTRRLKLSACDIVCRGYIIKGAGNRPVLLVKLQRHGDFEDFKALAAVGATMREIEVLSYLPLGYTNCQIAMAMGITVDGVKKHLKNLTKKIGAQGRTEILYRALWLRQNIGLGPDGV